MKAVFIDGASFHHLGLALKIEHFDLQALSDLLCNKLGEERVLVSPICVTVSQYMSSLKRERYTSAGYEMLEKTSKESRDDLAIIDRIDGLDPAVVRELVLISTDRDFLPILQKKAAQGISVIWVGTRAHDIANNRPLMTTKLFPFLDGTNGIQFYDLQRSAATLMLVPHKPKPKPRPQQLQQLPLRKLVMEVTGHMDSQHHEILNAIVKILKKYPSFKLKAEF